MSAQGKWSGFAAKRRLGKPKKHDDSPKRGGTHSHPFEGRTVPPFQGFFRVGNRNPRRRFAVNTASLAWGFLRPDPSGLNPFPLIAESQVLAC
jgi:hypothetical protein